MSFALHDRESARILQPCGPWDSMFFGVSILYALVLSHINNLDSIEPYTIIVLNTMLVLKGFVKQMPLATFLVIFLSFNMCYHKAMENTF